MKVFIVYYHPEPKSFNHAMFETAKETFVRKHCEIRCSDLNAMKFDSRPGRSAYCSVADCGVFRQQMEEKRAAETNSFAPFLEDEMRKLEWCDLLLMQFPLWWFGLPSPLKGWVERVFAFKRIYDGSHMYSTGRFAGKRAMLSLTTGAPSAAYVKGGQNGDINGILRPVQRGILQFVGFSVLRPNIVFAPAHMNDCDRAEALKFFASRLESIGDETPFEPGRF